MRFSQDPFDLVIRDGGEMKQVQAERLGSEERRERQVQDKLCCKRREGKNLLRPGPLPKLQVFLALVPTRVRSRDSVRAFDRGARRSGVERYQRWYSVNREFCEACFERDRRGEAKGG